MKILQNLTLIGLIMLVNGITIEEKTHHNPCKAVKGIFILGLQEFYSCMLKETVVDFAVCQNCSDYFWTMFSGFELLKNTTDTRPGHENAKCIDELLHKDRMDYWSRIHAEAVKLWDDANCYKCHDWNGTFVTDPTIPVHQNLTADFQTFLNYTEELKTCEDRETDNICQKCEKIYTDLNKFYEGIKKKDKAKICFDIENSMNRTRLYWSGNLGCCHDDGVSFTVFSILASIIGILPIIFYSSAYLITKRQENLSLVVDDEQIVAPNMRSINNEPLPGTSNEAGSDASTAVLDDESPTRFVRNGLKEEDIAKKSNIDVNPINLLPKKTNTSTSQMLIDLEKVPEAGVSNVPKNLLDLDNSL
ncbi:uncharacterized protein LOC134829230 [Culicoides brevitarsis]|uniref:uncharacterized protein LOC134829230 n=1 Tax=Culicoides brevitarsis TaxID=469753 RepID=UPI00307B76D9